MPELSEKLFPAFFGLLCHDRGKQYVLGGRGERIPYILEGEAVIIIAASQLDFVVVIIRPRLPVVKLFLGCRTSLAAMRYSPNLATKAENV